MGAQYKSVSIIIRTYNRPNLLLNCLDSLFKQIRKPDEIVIVNDGGETVNHLLDKYNVIPIRLIDNKKNMGRSASGNLGVENTTGEVIGFLDDDDVLLSDHIARLEQAMIQFDQRVVYSGCYLARLNVLGNESIVRKEIIGEYNDAYEKKRLLYENYIPLICLLIDRKLWEEIGGFDPSIDLFEDWDMLIRLAMISNFYHVNKITAVYHIWGGDQVTQTTTHSQWLFAYQRIIRKHMISNATDMEISFLSEYWMVSQQRRQLIQRLIMKCKQYEDRNRNMEAELNYQKMLSNQLKEKLGVLEARENGELQICCDTLLHNKTLIQKLIGQYENYIIALENLMMELESIKALLENVKAYKNSNGLFRRLIQGIEAVLHFDAAWYRKKYPDVAKSGRNPFTHYLFHGLREGRKPFPSNLRQENGNSQDE